MHSGDFAVLLRSPDYSHGDVVAFPVQQGAVVIHRIVGGDSSQGYVMQGDNKELPDDWRPTSATVMGRLWVHLPGVGHAIAPLRQPTGLAALLAVLGLLLLGIDDRLQKSRLARSGSGWSAVKARPRTSSWGRVQALLGFACNDVRADLQRLSPMVIPVSEMRHETAVHHVGLATLNDLERAARLADRPILALTLAHGAQRLAAVHGDTVYELHLPAHGTNVDEAGPAWSRAWFAHSSR